MNRKILGTLLLAVAIASPAAAAPMLQTSGAAPATSSPTDLAQEDSVTSTQSQTNASNYTRLYLHDRYHHVEVKPGQTDSFTVTVENGEDRAVELNPHVVVPRVGERPVKKDWVSISAVDGDNTLGPNEEREYNVTVSVPEGVELGNYDGTIAFTDETITYPGRPPRPVHGASFNVEVWKQPTVQILSGDYAYAQVQAGGSYTHSIVIMNTGDEAVPVNPQLNTQDRRRYHRGGEQTLQRSWLTIDAPTEIEPGETVTVNVTIEPPASADRGDYDTELDLGLKDPARPDRDSYWQQIHLNFQIWKQPNEPFVKSFDVSNDTESVSLKLDADNQRRSGSAEDPSFDVVFVKPDGTTVQAERDQFRERGYVDLGGRERNGPRSDTQGPYASGGSQQTFTYTLEDPAAGEWDVEIMPHNTMRFGYELVHNESE